MRSKAFEITNSWALLFTVKLFGKQQRVDLLLDAQRRNDITSITNKLKKYILIELQFIDAVCSSANKDLPFQGHDESSTSLNNWNSCKKKNNLMHNLFLVYFVNLYMFRAFRGPSSGITTVCIQVVLIILFRWLSVVLVGLENPTRATNSHLKRIISTTCIHTVVRPDDGPRNARNI